MPAIFGPRANLLTNVGLLAFAGLGSLTAFLIWGVPRSQYNTQQSLTPPQPVPFSHKHHVGDDGIDCRYCHSTVEISANAGVPATATCMTCHSQLFTQSDVLAPVRASYLQHKNLRWNRVYALPDYVYFDHSIHVAKGVGCTECHGPIGAMPLTRRASDLTMQWCLDCHRDPGPHLRPHDQEFNAFWQRTKETPSADQLVAAYHIHTADLTDCTVCHR
ncbi:MAG: cytochrome c3 family protein [Alphaproteobacteria bacterium]|nr:cytochrome c3 family protein [Alphaproteobacteria bacterium]